MTPLRRLSARIAARHLTVFVIPDVEIARNAGIDVMDISGLRVVTTPRHADVLLIAGPIPPGLARAAGVVYAQMPRPRWILAAGTRQIEGLPLPDVTTQADQSSVITGISQIRQMIEDDAFRPDVVEFALAAVRTRTVFVCPMHPQIVQATPGSCPICGMALVPQEVSEDAVPQDVVPEQEHAHPPSPVSPEAAVDASAGYTCPMHPDIIRNEPGTCPICGMTLVPREHEADDAAALHSTHSIRDETDGTAAAEPHAEHAHRTGDQLHRASEMTATAREPDAMASETKLYAQDMRPPADGQHHGDAAHREPPASEAKAASAEEAVALGAHAGHEMGGMGAMDEHAGHMMGDDGATMDHSSHMGGGFMSMIEITKDLPRSRDGLPMDWIDVPFGPLFAGLPGGLALKLTLDGDTVAVAEINPGAASRQMEASWPGAVDTLHERAASLDLLAPNAYAALAWNAIATAGGVAPDEEGQRACVGVLERARALSHLGWLSAFGRLLGYRWLEEQAAGLQRTLVNVMAAPDLVPVRRGSQRLIDRIDRTPMLRRRLGGIGVIPPDGYGDWLTGPVARAAGRETDARAADPAYRSLGFVPVTRQASDALARLEVRLYEVIQSLELLQNVGIWILPSPRVGLDVAEAQATLEMPRGQASIHVALDQGEVRAVHVTVPSTMHVDMLPVVAETIELADSLIAIASLDISPWEIDQ